MSDEPRGLEYDSTTISEALGGYIHCDLCRKWFRSEQAFIEHHEREHPDYPSLSINSEKRIADLERQLAELTARLDAMEAGK